MVKSIWDGLDWSYLLEILVSVIPSLICITVHEFSHGLAAYRLGDNTAKNMGRLSLNPLRHIDVFGLLMMVVFKFGWAKPVPVNMYNFKNPKRGMAITAFAGPMSNLLLTVIFLALYGLLYGALYDSTVGWYILYGIYMTAYLSLSLAIFNIIPIPPLDGSKVLFSLLSNEKYNKLMRYEKYGMLILLVIVATGILGSPLSKVTQWLFARFYTIAETVFNLVN